MRLATFPAALAVPADGRLDGYGYTASVLGATTAHTVNGRTAGSGEQWWVVGLRWQVTPNLTPPVAVTVAVDADGRITSLPLPAGAAVSPDTGPLYWAVTEPTAADVTITATSGGQNSTFSLSRLRRLVPAPPVLYRTPGQWQTTVPVDRTVTETIPAFDGAPGGGLTIDLHAVTLTDFGPTGPNDTPPPGATAWLTLDISSTNSPSQSTGFYSALTASQITLTLPGQAPLDATVTPGGGLDTANNGVFPDRYAFAVPDTITTATLTVTPTGLSVGNLTDPLATVNGPAATLPLTLPAPVTPTAPADAASAPRHYNSIGTAPTNRGPTARRAGGQTAPTRRTWTALPALLVAVVVLATVGITTTLLGVRRRRRRAATDLPGRQAAGPLPNDTWRSPPAPAADPNRSEPWWPPTPDPRADTASPPPPLQPAHDPPRCDPRPEPRPEPGSTPTAATPRYEQTAAERTGLAATGTARTDQTVTAPSEPAGLTSDPTAGPDPAGDPLVERVDLWR